MNNQIRIALVVVILGAITLTIYLIEIKKPGQISIREIKKLALPTEYIKKENKAAKYDSAVEIVRPSGFINSEEFKLEDFIGKKVILIDFWTYSCINCQRTLPYLNAWHQKYKDVGLEIIGIHTPEFEFEKDRNNVLAAVKKYGVKHRVVQDNEFATWRAYNNRYWPTKYLIDIDGYIVYQHSGEGLYVETEAKIVELLNERKQRLGEASVALDINEPADVDKVDFRKINTPELYLGFSRIEAIANLPSKDCFGKECEYTKPGLLFANKFAFTGNWRIEPEYAELTKGTGSIIIRFSANKVNLVAGGSNNREVEAQIYLDGVLVSDNFAGSDVTNGIIKFGEFDLYNLIDLRGDYSSHRLEIRILEAGLEAYAFTFG